MQLLLYQVMRPHLDEERLQHKKSLQDEIVGMKHHEQNVKRLDIIVAGWKLQEQIEELQK
jgi:hypothetical protein